MAELDKKIQKAQTDLVQSVLEAQEKRNIERVEMLVTNAIKQLKMSRFKPDLATCLGLTYLARISPKVFNQSSAIKEVLKSLLRRDNGPANIKSKNDIVLPVLAANILLASCDSVEIRQIILNKIEQWLNGSCQKASDLIQQLLAAICMKCHKDQQTIDSLIEMRHHWLQYLEESADSYGSTPVDLCASVRKLLHSEANCESLLVYLKFLIKHDLDIDGLSKEISKFIIERPISLSSMLNEDDYGSELNKMLMRIFNKLLTYLKSSDLEATSENGNKQKPDTVDFSKVVVKTEPQDPVTDDKSTFSDKKPTEQVPPTSVPLADSKVSSKEAQVKNETVKNEQVASNKCEDETTQETTSDQLLYVKLPQCSNVIVLSQVIIEAILTLLALFDEKHEDCRQEFDQLLDYWLIRGKVNEFATIYQDHTSTTPYTIPDHLRHRLAHSPNDHLIELSLHEAGVGQLLKLLHLFGSPLATINKIFKRLEIIKDTDLLKSEIRDPSFFTELLEFYSNLGAPGAQELHKRLKIAL